MKMRDMGVVGKSTNDESPFCVFMYLASIFFYCYSCISQCFLVFYTIIDVLYPYMHIYLYTQIHAHTHINVYVYITTYITRQGRL